METLKSPQIKDIIKEGNLIKTDYMIVFFRRNNLGFPRFAFILSRKFSKKAVDRNRTKRIIKEAIRLYGETLKDMGYDIVLIPKKGILGKKTSDLYKDIKLIEKKLEENVKKSIN